MTDDIDRRLLMCILSQYYSPAVLSDNHLFTASGTYKSPPAGDLASYVAHIRGLPLVDEPEVFGLHSNAAITFNLQEARKLLDTVLSLQPRLAPSGAASDGSGKTPEEALVELAAQIEAGLPPELSKERASVVRSPFAPLASGHDNSLGTVLLQEMDRFNALRGVLKRSCYELQRAVKGLAVMSSQLEDMAVALANNQVPSLWAKAAYPSLKPLAAWVRDFSARMAFMENWVTEGQPPNFWLPGFFFPQVSVSVRAGLVSAAWTGGCAAVLHAATPKDQGRAGALPVLRRAGLHDGGAAEPRAPHHGAHRPAELQLPRAVAQAGGRGRQAPARRGRVRARPLPGERHVGRGAFGGGRWRALRTGPAAPPWPSRGACAPRRACQRRLTAWCVVAWRRGSAARRRPARWRRRGRAK